MRRRLRSRSTLDQRPLRSPTVHRQGSNAPLGQPDVGSLLSKPPAHRESSTIAVPPSGHVSAGLASLAFLTKISLSFAAWTQPKAIRPSALSAGLAAKARWRPCWGAVRAPCSTGRTRAAYPAQWHQPLISLARQRGIILEAKDFVNAQAHEIAPAEGKLGVLTRRPRRRRVDLHGRRRARAPRPAQALRLAHPDGHDPARQAHRQPHAPDQGLRAAGRPQRPRLRRLGPDPGQRLRGGRPLRASSTATSTSSRSPTS